MYVRALQPVATDTHLDDPQEQQFQIYRVPAREEDVESYILPSMLC